MGAVTCNIRDLSHAERQVIERLLGERLGGQGELTIVPVASTVHVGDHGTANPYAAPKAAPLRTRFKNPADKWSALGLVGLGLAMLGLTIVQIIVYRRISGLFAGISFALMVLGWLKYSLSTRIVE